MYPVHQQVQVQTDAADWDGSGSSTSSSSNRCNGLGCTRLINRLDPVQVLYFVLYRFDTLSPQTLSINDMVSTLKVK